MRVLAIVCMLAATATAAESGDDAAMGRRVQDLLHAHQADVFGCVQSANAKVSGEMLIRVVVGDDQRPSKSEVLKDQSGGGPLGLCLSGKIKQWDLTPLQASAGDQVVFPLVFKPEKLKPGEKRILVPMAAQEVAGPQRFLVDEETIGEPPLASLQLLTVQPNQTVPASAPSQAEEVALYVLEGSFQRGEETLKAGDALWLGAGEARPTLKPLDGKPLRLLEARAHGDGKGQKIVHADAIKTLPISGGKAEVRLALDGTGAKLAVDELSAEAGVTMPQHKHPGSDEILLILSGHARTTVGAQTFEAVTGDVLRIAANQTHSMQAVEALRVIQVYAPAGPEQRFKPQAPEPSGKGKGKRKGGKAAP